MQNPSERDRKSSSYSRSWTRALRAITKPVLKPFVALSHHAATHPKTYIVGTIVLSIGLMALGMINFEVDTSDSIWTPKGSRPVKHSKWIDDESNFPVDPWVSIIVVHRDGKPLFGDNGELALESTERLFESLEHFRNTPRYEELCQFSDYIPPYATSKNVTERTCQVVGASSFWNDAKEIFEQQAISNDAVLKRMSAPRYPYGGVVDHDQIIGYTQFDDAGTLTNAKSYVTVLLLPPDKEDEDTSEAFTKSFEKDVIDRMLDLQDEWNADDTNNGFKVEFIADRSFEDEFSRAVTKDLPLLPVVFVLMSILCILFFAKRDPVLSRGWLGFGAVCTVLLSITASFGLLFLIGVPFTSLTPLLPFIMFGVGLDDAFIISGAFARTDHTKNVVDRVDDAMNDIMHTILLTTTTSALAFALGAVSSIPAVQYLVMYAFPTIMIDFMFQITFFVALIVIDQKRLEENRRDCCFCCKAKDVSQASTLDVQGKSERHCADRLMAKYTKLLLKTPVKWFVLLAFSAMLAIFSWRTSELKQYFDFTTVIPSDSYIQTWFDAYENYYEENGVRAFVYFRNVDFADENIRDQMEDYVQELSAMSFVGGTGPFSFWLRDFRDFVGNDTSLQGLAFEDQLKSFLEDPIYYESHHEDIVLDENGVMTASRTLLMVNNIEHDDVLAVVDYLEEQREITSRQPINQGLDDWKFFSFGGDYFIFEFYRVSPDELRLTTIIGTISVSFLAFIFIPHWSAILFVGPMVAILYIDLLGFIELCGIYVNPVMYISTVMSIGLMVDFVMHVTLRYVETAEDTSRTKKTSETMESIGSSVLIGGISTIIGVLPLALSTSEIFWTTFIIFFGLVLLGLLHGLVLLPVLLSMFGPLESIYDEDEKVVVPEEGDETSRKNSTSDEDINADKLESA